MAAYAGEKKGERLHFGSLCGLDLIADLQVFDISECHIKIKPLERYQSAIQLKCTVIPLRTNAPGKVQDELKQKQHDAISQSRSSKCLMYTERFIASS